MNSDALLRLRMCLAAIRDELSTATADMTVDRDGQTLGGKGLISAMTRGQGHVSAALAVLDDLEGALPDSWTDHDPGGACTA